MLASSLVTYAAHYFVLRTLFSSLPRAGVVVGVVLAIVYLLARRRGRA